MEQSHVLHPFVHAISPPKSLGKLSQKIVVLVSRGDIPT